MEAALDVVLIRGELGGDVSSQFVLKGIKSAAYADILSHVFHSAIFQISSKQSKCPRPDY